MCSFQTLYCSDDLERALGRGHINCVNLLLIGVPFSNDDIHLYAAFEDIELLDIMYTKTYPFLCGDHLRILGLFYQTLQLTFLLTLQILNWTVKSLMPQN